MKYAVMIIASLLFLLFNHCKKAKAPEEKDERVFYTTEEFVMGADLSYVNEVLDHNGVYRDSGTIEDPYNIFAEYGNNVVRFRVFHNPEWTAENYGGGQMYHDFNDVKHGIARSKAEGMKVLLDFHYSDTWADPGKQDLPLAWENLNLQELHDSLYNYTYKILTDLDEAGLMPEYVQVGNEINPGFVLPHGSRWNGNKTNMVYLLNSAIKAVRDAGAISSIMPEIVIHIAQPENVIGWFSGLDAEGLTDYDIIGFSYYYSWSSVQLYEISNYTLQIRTLYGKEVMIAETAYPWTIDNADNYNNIIDIDKLNPLYPATESGQYNYLRKLTQEIIDGGGKGIFYWEPAWISAGVKTLWGEGSAWEQNTFFDFQGNVIDAMDYMTFKYDF